MRTEPVFFLAFVQHHLQRPHTYYEQPDTPVVNAGALSPQVRRIENKRLSQEDRKHSNRHIDIEDPAPAVIVSEPPADYRAKHRRDHNSERPKRHGLATFFRGERLQQDRL